MFVSRGDRDLGVAFLMHAGSQSLSRGEAKDSARDPWHLSASLSMTLSIFSVFFQDPENLSQCLPVFFFVVVCLFVFHQCVEGHWTFKAS